ncbi:MAG: uroporphyrinogen-III synthase [Methanomassiliicoccales archaeon]|nr:uroporphyrinogen-III synthase [Methanomassiliicoccales archaeon]
MIRLAIMRPEEKIGESVEMAKSLGFEPICASPLKVKIVDSDEYDVFLQRVILGKIDIVIITSAIGARAMINLADKRGRKNDLIEALKRVCLVTIGPETAKSIESAGIHVDMMPKTFSSEGVIELLSAWSIEGKSIFLLRSDKGEKKLVEKLKEFHAEVTEIIVYLLVPDVEDPGLLKVIDALVAEDLDILAFTSPLSARVFLKAAMKKYPERIISDALDRSIVAAIGEPTKRTLESCGVRVDVVPPMATFESLLNAIKSRISN